LLGVRNIMTKYRDSTESVDTDGNTLEVTYFWDIKCDNCGKEQTVEESDGRPCTFQLGDGWFINNDISGGQGFHLCPSCRYQGATVEFLQWKLNPAKMGVDIVGALKSTLRICDNMQQITDELKAKLSRVLMPDEGGPDKEVYEAIDRIVNLINMARANENIALAELADFGK
jgi:hypothetical protein